MIKRPTWIMVIVLALIAGLAYYMQAVPDNFIQKALTAGNTPTVVSRLNTGITLITEADGPVKGISLTDADGHSVALKRETAGWMLSIDAQSPIPADQSAAEMAATQSQGLLMTVTDIPVTSSDLSGFGLDKPAYIYELIVADDRNLAFKIGSATVTGDGYYIQRADGKIAVVNKYTMDALLNMLQQPPRPVTPTPSPAPATESPEATTTPTPSA